MSNIRTYMLNIMTRIVNGKLNPIIALFKKDTLESIIKRIKEYYLITYKNSVDFVIGGSELSSLYNEILNI